MTGIVAPVGNPDAVDAPPGVADETAAIFGAPGDRSAGLEPTAAEKIRRWAASRKCPDDPSTALESLVVLGLLELPMTSSGRTWERFEALARVAEHDLSTARLAEGHTDALAVLAEAGDSERVLRSLAGGRLGVWAAGPLESLQAVPGQAGRGLVLDGTRHWCSGALSLTHALVTAATAAGEQLVLVDLASPGVRPEPDSWPAIGMAGSETLDVSFERVRVPEEAMIGPPGFYLSRPGFWKGAVGVAACWYGGAVAAAQPLGRRAMDAERSANPHGDAHRGAVAARLFAMEVTLREAARLLDNEPMSIPELQSLALAVRHVIESGALEVLERTGRATGAGPLGHDAAHARRAADLPVYIRQSHAEADLETLGSLLRGRHVRWAPLR